VSLLSSTDTAPVASPPPLWPRITSDGGPDTSAPVVEATGAVDQLRGDLALRTSETPERVLRPAPTGHGEHRDRPLRILHLANDLLSVGNGIVHVMVDLAIEQRRVGHDVTVGAADGEFAELLRANGVRHVVLPQKGVRHAAAAVARLAELIRRERVDIIHAHMVSGALAARLAVLGSRTRVITHVHNSWQRHATFMGAGHRVIAVSEAVRQEMVQRGVPAERISTVLNGTLGSKRDEALKYSRKEMPQEGDVGSVRPVMLKHPALLTVAGMYHRKGIGDLLEATALLRKNVEGVTVYLAGEGPDRSEFEARARERGLGECVVFLGYRPDARDLMRQADVFVLASREDPNPLVIAEARAAGVPIVATAVGGIPESLEGGRAGLLVPPREPRALSEALARVLLDEALRERLSRAASENLEWLDVRRMADDTLAVYRRALRRG
jgi:glycosyltransferase involved in cell wall biosynthesis